MLQHMPLFFLGTVAAAVHSVPLNVDAAEFSLFAYGKGVPGRQVVQKNGAAFLAAKAIPPGCQNVTFRRGGSDGQIEARTAGNGTAELFAIPTTSGLISFARDATNASETTTGFGLYGSSLYRVADGTMKMDWFARPAGGDDDLWELGWQLAGDGAVQVALRNMAPSSPAK